MRRDVWPSLSATWPPPGSDGSWGSRVLRSAGRGVLLKAPLRGCVSSLTMRLAEHRHERGFHRVAAKVRLPAGCVPAGLAPLTRLGWRQVCARHAPPSLEGSHLTPPRGPGIYGNYLEFFCLGDLSPPQPPSFICLIVNFYQHRPWVLISHFGLKSSATVGHSHCGGVGGGRLSVAPAPAHRRLLLCVSCAVSGSGTARSPQRL